MFSGLAQTGAWACLDEFNRIEVEVLSVVASQISAVMQAIKAELNRFVFDGISFSSIPCCLLFTPTFTHLLACEPKKNFALVHIYIYICM